MTANRVQRSTRSNSLFLLFLLFLGLRLAHVIHWSWWLVFLPLYAGFGLFLAVAFSGAAVAIVTGALLAVVAGIRKLRA